MNDLRNFNEIFRKDVADDKIKSHKKAGFHPLCRNTLLEKRQVVKKNKLRSHFLEKIFWPVDSKSLRLRCAAFEMQLSDGVWGSPFKRPLLSVLKQFLVY